jgi:FkbM family methyltransferase
MIKKIIKAVLKSLPFDFTKNQQYDTQTQQILRRHCKEFSNCIDIGCHKGEVLDWILAAAPQGQHYGFEPLPDLYLALKSRYAAQKNCCFSDIALSDKAGEATFNYVVTNPAYSGLQKRNYDKPNEKDETITVKTATLDSFLDSVLPADYAVDFIKIDVEGGELQVLRGAVQTLRRCQPIVVFEHGLGAADCYGTKPKDVWQLFADCNMSVSLMKSWLKGAPALSLAEFEQQFEQAKNYYFIAYPKKS